MTSPGTAWDGKHVDAVEARRADERVAAPEVDTDSPVDLDDTVDAASREPLLVCLAVAVAVGLNVAYFVGDVGELKEAAGGSLLVLVLWARSVLSRR